MRRDDVQEFAFSLEENLEQLYQEIAMRTYHHGPYRVFVRCDPKRRVIAVPAIRDQIVHHFLVGSIGPTFEHAFHPHSYASRPERGVLAAVETVHRWIACCSDGGRQRCWALRMDIASFFASVDHAVLGMLRLDAPDRKTSITSVARGVDWIGFVLFPHHRVLRPVTLRRIRGHIRSRVFGYLDDGFPYDRLRATFASYDGLLRCASHGLERNRLLALQRTI